MYDGQQSLSRLRARRTMIPPWAKNAYYGCHFRPYIHCVPKSDAKIQITITTAYLIRINYHLSSFNYRLSGTKVANFNKIHHMVSFLKMELKTEFSTIENTN